MAQLSAEAPAKRRPYGWASIAIAIIFGVFYVYVLWSAIENLIALPQHVAAVRVPWVLLIVDAALPVLLYALAFWLGWRRALPIRALYYFIGFTVLACATVGSIAFVQTH